MERLNHHADAFQANRRVPFHAKNNLKVCTFPKLKNPPKKQELISVVKKKINSAEVIVDDDL